MKDIKTKQFPDTFVLTHYAIIATVMVLLDKSQLTPDVIKHCKMGLKIIGIIHADTSYSSGKKPLHKKEFDAFFTLFPDIYFNNRETIPVNMIIENIERCIKSNVIVKPK